jgi:cysteine desulfurase
MRNKPLVYLDHSATTPTDPRVVEAMLPYFTEMYGNSSSAHYFGRQAESAIERAREQVAEILNCQPSEVIFTSCGSESDNLAIRGAAWLQRQMSKRRGIITTPAEHEAVSRTMQQLGVVMGFDYQVVPVDHRGMCQPETFAAYCDADTAVASVIYANNEVGTVQPIRELAAIAHKHGVLFHTDAVQAGGQLTLNVEQLGVDMLSLSAHKFYGPKGVGLLYVRDGIDLLPSQTGGSHELGRRAGTHNTPLIVGLAKALELAYAEPDTHITHYRAMRDRLVTGVLTCVPEARLSGHPEARLPSHASFVFPGIDSSTLLMHLDVHGIAASGGSACKTGNPEPSAVLLALGYDAEEAIGGLRLTVGRQTTEAEIDYAVEILSRTVRKLYEMKSAYVR